MRKWIAAIVAAALAMVAWKTPGYVEERRASPFALWELRAGMRFGDAEALMIREERRRFTCHAIVASSRLCTVRVTGIPGTLRSVVDGRDRIVLLAFHPDTASVVLREEGRKVAAEWKMIRPAVSANPDDESSDATITRWTSEDFRWVASMRYDGESTSPTFLRVVDAHALERIAASGPLARLVLEANGVLEADQLELAAALLRFRQGSGTDTSDFTPIPARAPSAPLCEPVVPDLPVPGDDARDAMTSGLALMIESALSETYPGWRLILGRGTWMTDPSGRPERVTIGPQANSSSDAMLAFPVVFPARARVSADQRASLEPATHCRAPTEIVIARRAPPDGSFRDARRLAFDPDGMATEVAELDLIVSDDETSAMLAIRYITADASDRWSGWVSWMAGLPVTFADSAVPGVRVPLRYGFDIGKDESSADGTLVVTGRGDEGLELTTLEQHQWGYASRTIVVPLDSAGALRGAELLARLF